MRDHEDAVEINSFWPLYTGTSIPEDLWRDRMWLDTWV
ncbi:dolichyl-phosphate-mannose--protein O-mannosyl transferase [Streptomyces sp. DSM 41269]|nr:dolichyl-phosphate-mannose--protein O-mannosyl transferase [Streptomyces sp. DSM 41269]